jgi:hypothetical protein
MKIIILSLFFLPQNDTINIDTLERSLIEFYSFKTQSEIIEFSQVEKLRFLKFLPVPALVRIDGALRFQMSFSVAQIYGFANEQAKREQSILSIQKSNESELNTELQQLRNDYYVYQNTLKILERKRENLKTEAEILRIETQLYDIDKSKYKRNELSPAQFLLSQKSLINAKAKFESKEFEILQIEINVENLCLNIEKIAKKL